MRHLFIINPVAGKKNSTQMLMERLSTLSVPHEVVFTEGVGHACQLARQAAQAGPVRIYACGGDGTLNEVVNGAAGFEQAAVTCVPKGTGNDFLKLFGPDYRSLFSDLEALAAGPQSAFDLMDCNGTLGIDVVCGGVDARVAGDVHKYKNRFCVSGIGTYILALMENIFIQGICRPMSVQMGPIRYNGPTAIVCICNGRHYGGGFMPVADAMPDDGILDMLLVRQVRLMTFLRLLGQYAKGNYKKYPNLVQSFHGQEIHWSSDQELVTVVDGEILRGKEFTVRLSEKKVQFFYPAGASWAPKIESSHRKD